LHRIQLAERSDRNKRPARRFVIYADSAPPHKSRRGRAAAGVHRAAMSALIVIFVFVIFSFWWLRAAPFKRRDLQQE
jgi:hypothetical protein